MTSAARDVKLVGMLAERSAISGARAIEKGTQMAKGAKAKPKWRQSEIDVGKTLGPKAREQVSYLNGKEVRRGLEDSVRPDFVIGNSASFEVKNYTIATNKDGLIRDVVSQVKKRAIHLPEGMEQHIRIDIRGQEVTPEMRMDIARKIQDKTGGIVTETQVKFIGPK
jgi:filamentous hemagglutinin